MNRFGFGAMRLPLINPDDKQSIDMDELKRMVDIYMEAGFTYCISVSRPDVRNSVKGSFG